MVKMPSNPNKDAIVIALDIGKSVSILHDNEEKSFFELAVDCVSWIIQRKIISQSLDVLSLLLIGCNSSLGSSNVIQKFDFQLASWDMLKFITKEVKPTNYDSDWFKAFIIAGEKLKEYDEYNSISGRKIVILSDFTQSATDDLKKIIRSVNDIDIEITIIGLEHVHIDKSSEPDLKKKKSDNSRLKGKEIVCSLWKKLPERVSICTFESALKQLCSYIPKPQRINFWNCTMDIGHLNINISMVKKTDPKPSKKFNTKCIKPSENSNPNTSNSAEEITRITKDIVMHYKHESDKTHEIVDIEVTKEDTIEGFRYGRTIIPFSGEDKMAMEYKTGPKTFSVLGFTSISNVPYYLLSGECSYLVVPRNSDQNAERALSAFIQAMKKLGCLAIVKKVHNDNWGLSLGILFPMIEEIYCEDTDETTYKEYLLFIELAFEDDIKPIDFPPLDEVAKKITSDQFDAIDDLIDDMNLMEADRGLRGEPCEAFDTAFLHDFKEQFFHFCVIHKGLNPNDPLPTDIPPYIKSFIEVPKAVEEKSKSALDNIKKRFHIKKIEKNNEKSMEKRSTINLENRISDQNQIEHFSESDIAKESDGTIRKWMRLFQYGFPTEMELNDIFITMANLDRKIVLCGFKEVISRVHTIYSNSNINPIEYNQWMIKFKIYLDGKGGLFSDIWDYLIESSGLVSSEVNKLSNVSNEEAIQYIKVAINKTCVPQNEKPNFEFLDELQAEMMDLDSSSF